MPGTRPLVVDPFAGGGSIPLEALRVGADAFASDLNPVAVLLNKVVLEYIPKYGQPLADEVRKWGEWIKREAEKELAAFYPKDPNGAIPIAYLWARTIQCEGPGCGAEVPLIRSFWLAKKANRSVALQLVPNLNAKRVDFQIIVKQHDGWVDQVDLQTKIDNPKFDGTVKRGSATCPCCGYTTPVARVREQLKARRGGADDARLLCAVTAHVNDSVRSYRLSTERDFKAVEASRVEIQRRITTSNAALPIIPNEHLPPPGTLGFRVQPYGMTEWGHLFTARQLVTLTTLTRLVREAYVKGMAQTTPEIAEAVVTVLALCSSKLADLLNPICTWQPTNDRATHLFAKQTIQMTWDFAESTGAADAVGNFGVSIANIVRILEREAGKFHAGRIEEASATVNPLPDDIASAVVTDPPYYDAVPYADLSDFFFVWLKRSLQKTAILPQTPLTPKENECIVDAVRGKDRSYFENTMKRALAEVRRVLAPEGIGMIVFAHKSTSSWEAQLHAMIDAGWVITGSWPIDTEWETRLRAMNSAALASSVHLVCRPRENSDGSLRTDDIGDWRDVLQELPRRIHEWMPRLADEGVVGADAIFACLGPALEIFSRYSRVEKASGEVVTLKEYLEQVWAAVAKGALNMIFEGGDATGFEEDARLTAMWLWTLNAGNTDAANGESTEEEEGDDESEGGAKKSNPKGFVLEFDAARKIAQGLGAHLEHLTSLVEVKGETARLLPVSERVRTLFGKDEAQGAAGKRRKRDPQLQLGFMQALE
jgi:putative DNA methylase